MISQFVKYMYYVSVCILHLGIDIHVDLVLKNLKAKSQNVFVVYCLSVCNAIVSD